MCVGVGQCVCRSGTVCMCVIYILMRVCMRVFVCTEEGE